MSTEFDSTLEYRDVEGFPGYKVGNDGSVWSCKVGGHTEARGKWKRLKTRANKHGGHLQILLMPGRVMRYVHQLVLEHFVGPRPKGLQARHFPDQSPSNNAARNLSWSTPLVNQRDRDANGTNNKGCRHGRTKLTDDVVIAMRAEYATGLVSQSELARKHSLDSSTARAIVLRKSWTHI